MHHLVGSGGSFGANTLQAEIGLGDATAVEELEVRWAGSGRRDLHRDVPLDRIVSVREGAEARPRRSGTASTSGTARGDAALRRAFAPGNANGYGPGRRSTPPPERGQRPGALASTSRTPAGTGISLTAPPGQRIRTARGSPARPRTVTGSCIAQWPSPAFTSRAGPTVPP